ncbi:MAG: type II toxin-antitoxin system HicB family antitoxin [Vicinamibacteria bacterium]|nr:type II toxin-antitoxin system HicB family antitoxin [Vicinamibacteria bacterium]
MKQYVVRYKRDASGTWIATVPAVKGCHTYGRTLDQARARIREALVLFDDKADQAKLVDRVVLTANARALLTRVKAARTRAACEQKRSSSLTTAAARFLTWELGLSTRDAGQLLELSHQRIQQLVERD